MSEVNGNVVNFKAKRRVWRVKILAKELQAAGFHPDLLPAVQWGIIKRILKAKKLPAYYADDRTPVAIDVLPDGEGLELEFD